MISAKYVILIVVVLLIALGVGVGIYGQQSSLATSAKKIWYGVLPLSDAKPAAPSPTPSDFKAVWFTDFSGDRVVAVNRAGEVVWQQVMKNPPMPASGLNINTEFMTLAPNGDIMVTDADGMMVQEIDRNTHGLLWQYGVRQQQYCANCLHQPKKAYLLSNDEVLLTDANNRRVVIVNKKSREIVWEYGHKGVMGDQPGYLKGNRFAMPLDADAKQILISDTLQQKIMIVERASKNIIWEWRKADSKWLQNVWPTADGTFIAEDHLANEVFEVNRAGQILWTLHTLANGQTLNYPTDVIKLNNGNVLIAEGGRSRIIEVNPTTKEIVWQFGGGTPKGATPGLVTSIAVEY